MAQETETLDTAGLAQWPLLLQDLLGAVERVKAAKQALAEAESDLTMVARVARRTVNENKRKAT